MGEFALYPPRAGTYWNWVTDLNATANAIVLGDPKSQFAYCIMMWLFFTGVAVFAFFFVTGRTAMRGELREAFGRDLLNVTSRKALLVIFVAWFIACSWLYNSRLGSPFFAVERVGTGAQTVWRFTYHYPDRVRQIPADALDGWTGSIGWSGRTMRYALVAKFKDGREIESVGVNPQEFEAQAKLLEKWDIHVMGTNTPPAVAAPKTP